MQDFKKDFPIFENNPGIVFLDSTASSQKPRMVIDGMKYFMEHNYANIHRGAYSLSEQSEDLYEKSKEKVVEFINASYKSEISYTYNSTYALNMLVQSLRRSNMLKKWDKVLLSIVEHHANLVPWLILKEDIWIEIEYINVLPNFGLDMDDFRQKLDTSIKVVSFTYVSNVTGEIFDLEKAGEILNEFGKNNPKPLFIIDWSQAVPHFKVDVKKLDCDFLFFTWHKIMTDTWLGILYAKKEILKNLTPSFGWGWAINWVKKQEYSPSGLPFRFEPWTPHIIWAVSLLRALEYIESIGWYEALEKQEQELNEYFLNKLEDLEWKVKLIWWKNPKTRVSVFSMEVPWYNILDLSEKLAEKNICVRAGKHCVEPFFDECKINGSLRASLYLYNDTADIDKFFIVLKDILA